MDFLMVNGALLTIPRKIVRDAQANDYHFSSIILGIVNSAPFT